MLHRDRSILFNLLRLHNTLTLLAVDRLLLLLQTNKGIDTGHGTEDQTGRPRAVGGLLESLRGSQLPDADRIDDGDGVKGQVSGIAELATDGQVLEDRVDGVLVVESDGGGLEVLEEFADTHNLARRAELLLHGIVGVDSGLGLVGPVEVPRVEAGEVLEGAEDLIAADCMELAELWGWPWAGRVFRVVGSDHLEGVFKGYSISLMEMDGCIWTGQGSVCWRVRSRTSCRDEAQPVRQRRVVNESVGNHDSVFWRDMERIDEGRIPEQREDGKGIGKSNLG